MVKSDLRKSTSDGIELCKQKMKTFLLDDLVDNDDDNNKLITFSRYGI